MKQRKLRLIKSKQLKASEAYGITIPPDIAVFFQETYFDVSQSGTSIILTSGTQVTQIHSQIENLDLENYTV